MPPSFRVDGLLATGGMAEVYLGTMTGGEGFERRVAIKRILPKLASDERVIKMFAAEAKLASYLHHQNIVEVLDVGRSGSDFYIVMELVNGWDLGVLCSLARTQNLPFPPQLAAYVAQQVTLALCHAYRHQENGKQIIVAHRDISPSNILVSSEGEVKVADFGIARVDEGGTQPGVFKGKYAYAAPEVIMGEPANAASDQFALGLVLYETIAGVHPFGTHNDAIPYVRAIPTDPTPRLERAPAMLRQIVERMLEKSPSKRYPTPEDCSTALAKFLSHAGTPATPLQLANYVHSLNPSPPPLGPRGLGTAPADAPAHLALQPITTPPGVPGSTSGSFHHSGPALDATGRLVEPSLHESRATLVRGHPNAVVSGTREILLEPVAVEVTGGLELNGADGLELNREERFAPIPPHTEPAPVHVAIVARDRRVPRPVIFLLGVVALVTVGYFAFPSARNRLISRVQRGGLSAVSDSVSDLVPTKSNPVAVTVSFDSRPSGARVFVGGTELGMTPMALDNDYPETSIDVRMEKSGYRTWKGTFEGGKQARVQATLTR